MPCVSFHYTTLKQSFGIISFYKVSVFVNQNCDVSGMHTSEWIKAAIEIGIEKKYCVRVRNCRFLA